MADKISMCAVSTIVFNVTLRDSPTHGKVAVLDDGTEFLNLPKEIEVEGVLYDFTDWTVGGGYQRSAHFKRKVGSVVTDPTTLKFIEKVRRFRENNPEEVDRLLTALEAHPTIKEDREQDWLHARWDDKSLPAKYIYLDFLT
ncbi:MAG: hypothetical protein MN733_28800, partial [Nitrososphaera sp.]|nr:hypothetical protein [Nitrososphaera sp.]